MTPSSSPSRWNRRSAPWNSASAAGERVERNADLEADGHGGQRVEQVVAARHLQPQLAELDIACSDAVGPSGVQ